MTVITQRAGLQYSQMTTRNTNILIFDDNPDDCLLIEDLIVNHMANDKPKVFKANSFEQALEICYSNPDEIDLCLLDYRLGKRDGLRVLQDFREHGLVMPIIFLTGVGDEEVAVSAMHSGAANYFSKSKLDPGKFVKAIRAAIKDHKSFQSLEDLFS